MKSSTKLSRRVRTIAYYGGMILSVGLIWGGGMSALRESILEGGLAILLGLVMQLGLQRLDMDDGEDANPDSDHFFVRDFLRDAGKKRNVGAPNQGQGPDDERAIDRPQMRRRGGQGTDGATLSLDVTATLNAPLVSVHDELSSVLLRAKTRDRESILIVDGERIVASCSRRELLNYLQRKSNSHRSQ